MAVAATKNTLRIDGQLYLNPTNADTARGTPLGVHEKIAIVIAHENTPVFNRLGGHLTESLVRIESVTITTFLRSWDADMLGLIDPNIDVATSSGEPVITGDMGIAGRRLSASGNKILLVPKEPDEHPGIILYNAFATINDSNSMDFEINEDWKKTITFKSLPDASRRVYKMGRLEDLPV